MTQSEIARLQKYLRQKFGNDHITIAPGPHESDSVEVNLGGEFIGLIYRDEEDKEVSYDFHMTIMDIDLESTR